MRNVSVDSRASQADLAGLGVATNRDWMLGRLQTEAGHQEKDIGMHNAEVYIN